MNLISCQNNDELSSKAAALLIKKINETITKKGTCVLAIPGGRSVADLLQKLSPTGVDWSKVEIFMVDERVVSIDDTESNYKQANDLFLKRVNTNSHPFIMEKGVQHYDAEFVRAGTHFDIIVLGVGEDGHVAALFPNHPSLKVKGKKYIQFSDSPKPPTKRITASPDMIKDADAVILIFSSAEKQKAYDLFENKSINETKCPAKIALKAKELYLLKDF